jgi:dienelactone hydrolase
MKQKTLLLFLMCVIFSASYAQKKVLDHTVYDNWQSIGERKINANGDWIAYTVDVQEGDGMLIVQKTDSSFQYNFPRGYAAGFSYDGKFIVFKVKPPYSEIRAAKIKKKKADEMPKDSLAVIDLERNRIQKYADVASYKMPEKENGLLAILFHKRMQDTIRKPAKVDTSIVKKDTSKPVIPIIIEQVPDKKQKRKLTSKGEQDQDLFSDQDAEGDDPLNTPVQEGTDLMILKLGAEWSKNLQLVNEYYWSENGKILVFETSASKTNKAMKPQVSIWRSAEDRTDTLITGGNDFRNFAIDESGYQVAFLAERDSAFKSLQKFHKLWYWRNGDRGASVMVDKFSVGMKANWTVSEHYNPYFSKSGKRLFLGTSPIKPLKDTSLIEMDLVKLDVWHYNDDYLQPYQLKNADQESRRSYLSFVEVESRRFQQLADHDMPTVLTSKEGDGDFFVGISDKGNRIPMQWEGTTSKSVYIVNPQTGERQKIMSGLDGNPQISPDGRYVFWYDMNKRHYFTYSGGVTKNISKPIAFKLYDEDYDMPSNPTSYGVMKWHHKDSFVYVYDKYDIWRLDPAGIKVPLNITSGRGRKGSLSYRYINLDPEERFLSDDQVIYLKTFHEKNKQAGIASMKLCCGNTPTQIQQGNFALGVIAKARSNSSFIYTRETFAHSPDIYFSLDLKNGRKLSAINPQQSTYNWLTAELFTWKAYDGKIATGIVYKPEDFVPGKKYPMIAYFYETLSDGLYNYQAPSPTPSRLNIPFFVSRGYIVLAPDIHYQNGYPGKAAFDYVVSGARALVKKGWVDSTKMGIQGQSWGGYQVAHIITRTPLFAAAWAGAPVANMTSAYGGIRWESGMNRQFQYEKTQSRIGATLWQKPQLYIENSPLFHLPKVKTPLVIMSNDNDGAVPWYQGIEMFTAMRRLNQKVWLLNYNGEAHNLIERKNRKDIQIREQQFFDWLLKGEKPSVWLTKGVSAVEKGTTWGLETSLD